MATRQRSTKTLWTTLVVLILVVLAFAAIRVTTDWPNVASGTVPPEDSYDYRYAVHPFVAYAHILPGVVYLTLAPLQLWRRFRDRHLAVHRRTGRVLVSVGIVAGGFAVVVGVAFPFDGLLETSASVVFGAYFVAALVTAYRAIKAGDVALHRRWMIRAFAIGLAVGTIRLWIGLFQAFGLLSFPDSFGVAFWLSFVLHALAVERYLSRWPTAAGAAQPVPAT